MRRQTGKVELKEEFLKKIEAGKEFGRVRRTIDHLSINTICDSARCPNRSECFSRGTATFLIMGPVCTRNCRYCSVEKGKPEPLDENEPRKIAEAVKALKLNYVVITSTTRDDLEDGGLSHFLKTISAIRSLSPETRIEVLVPDFSGNFTNLEALFEAGISVFNHNIEVVKRLFSDVRPLADYERSLKLLKAASQYAKESSVLVKSGFMIGLGETMDEIKDTLMDLKQSGVDVVTIGQYLPPTRKHMKAVKFYRREEYDELKKFAEEIGFKYAAAGPYVRSSYRAEIINTEVKENA